MGDFEEAYANFNNTLRYLRGNNNIDYEQLGLKFKLFSCEALFNRGLCSIYLQQLEPGMQDLTFAAKEKVVPDHDVIDEAIREQAEVRRKRNYPLAQPPASSCNYPLPSQRQLTNLQGYTVFSIPVGIVYRPNEAKVKNLKAKDYLGKARLVAATDRSQTFTGFAGAEIKKMNGPDSAKDDRPQEKLSYAAANLVKKDIQSRYRQQSEPPLNRNVFPPTPPPESDKPHPPSTDSDRTKTPSRAESVRAGPKPRALDLTVAGFDRRQSGNTSSSVPPPTTRARAQSERGERGRTTTRDGGGTSNWNAGPHSRPKRSPLDMGYPDEVYDMYGRVSVASAGQRSRQTPRGQMIEEEEEGTDDGYANSDEADFDMLNAPRSRTGSARSSALKQPRPPEMKRVRVKVHADDTRYVMIGTAVEFKDFVDQIRLKFGLRQAFKVMMKEDGDMITMADQDDLEMAIDIARDNARKKREETGKMDVSIFLLPIPVKA